MLQFLKRQMPIQKDVYVEEALNVLDDLQSKKIGQKRYTSKMKKRETC
jgi:hypothetical protein